MNEQEFKAMFAEDIKANGITHELATTVWHGMNYTEGTGLVDSDSLNEYFKDKPYGYDATARWFWTFDGHRIQVRLAEVREVA